MSMVMGGISRELDVLHVRVEVGILITVLRMNNFLCLVLTK